jgi:hypothetical protein
MLSGRIETRTLTDLFEKALNENEELVESSSFELEGKFTSLGKTSSEGENLLREARRKAKSLLDYGLQFSGALRIAVSRKHSGINISEKYLQHFAIEISSFYELSDNEFFDDFRRKEMLKGIAMRYHVLKPYFLLSQYGVETEGKTISDFATILGKIREFVGIDETNSMCISSLSLFEIAINKKLADLGEKTEGEFGKRYERLVEVARKKEHKELPSVLPEAMYKARSILLHAGHEKIPTKKESEQIMKWIEEFITKLFEK